MFSILYTSDTETALRDYEPRVVNYTDQLLAQIQATSGRPINVTDWFNFYSFDVMGDLAFGKSFNMLKDGVKHYFVCFLSPRVSLPVFLRENNSDLDISV
jgi:cytochrome P450